MHVTEMAENLLPFLASVSEKPKLDVLEVLFSGGGDGGWVGVGGALLLSASFGSIPHIFLKGDTPTAASFQVYHELLIPFSSMAVFFFFFFGRRLMELKRGGGLNQGAQLGHLHCSSA